MSAEARQPQTSSLTGSQVDVLDLLNQEAESANLPLNSTHALGQQSLVSKEWARQFPQPRSQPMDMPACVTSTKCCPKSTHVLQYTQDWLEVCSECREPLQIQLYYVPHKGEAGCSTAHSPL